MLSSITVKKFHFQQPEGPLGELAISTLEFEYFFPLNVISSCSEMGNFEVSAKKHHRPSTYYSPKNREKFPMIPVFRTFGICWKSCPETNGLSRPSGCF